jgi:aminoglycoside phosphotransferase family enzyme
VTGVSLETKVARLRCPETYRGETTRVAAIETHMSWVFLTDRFVYKLKKPIQYDRLDYSTLELRRFHCEEEVRLNRRLAEKVYQGTVALTQEADGTLVLGGVGSPVEWLVHMQRLPADCMLDARLARGVVESEDVHPVALRIAEFFATARPVAISTDVLVARLEDGVRTDRQELCLPEFELPREQVEAVAERLLGFLDEEPRCFDTRVREQRIVEGHGDLRPAHICLTSEPVVIDCLEFCSELREVDPADELAFLALECERLGQPRVGGWFLEAYEQRTRDRIPRPLLDFYRGYRILRRAKIAAWHLREPASRDLAAYAARARRYLELGTRREGGA